MKTILRSIMFATVILLATMQLNAQTWEQLGNEINGTSQEYFGTAVAMNTNGNIIVVGAHKYDINSTTTYVGKVTAYEYNGVSWELLGDTLYGKETNDYFGYSIDINEAGDIIVIGAAENKGYDQDTGYVEVYQYNGADWLQVGTTIKGISSSNGLGRSVSINSDGTIIAISTEFNDDNGYNNGGLAQVYEFDGTDWVQLGNDFLGTSTYAYLGASVDLNLQGNILAIGCLGGYGTGKAEIYEYDGTTWNIIGSEIADTEAGAQFGLDIKLNNSGNTVAIGCPFSDIAGNNAGRTEIYEFDGSNWIQKGSTIFGDTNDISGYRIDMDSIGNTIIINDPQSDINGTSSGQIRVFEYNGIDWKIKADTLRGDTINCQFGESVSISADGNRIVSSSSICNNDTGKVTIYDYYCTTFSTIDTSVCNTYNSPNGNTYTTTGIYTDTIPNTLGCDSIMTINLTILNTHNTISETACFSYTSPSGNIYYTSGTYVDTIQNNASCDSIITINLTINNVDVSVTQITNVLTSNQNAATYQWIDCDNGNTAITGETSQTFTASTNGNYAVVISYNSCEDTSICYAVTGVGINNNYKNSVINLYPNPTKGKFIVTGNQINNIEIFDITGKLVYSIRINNKNKVEINKKLKSGIYFIKITSTLNTTTKKIIIN